MSRMEHPFLVGTLVYLRAVDRAEASIIVPWVNDQRVIRNLLIHRPTSLAAEEAFLESVSRSDTDVVMGICEKATDRLVGVCGLHRIDPKNRHAMYGIFIGEADARGKGLGSEVTSLVVTYAFDTLNLNRIWLHVYRDNKGAIRAYEKAGFTVEGVLRQDNFRDGRYGDTVVMGILRSEWKAKRPRPPAAKKPRST
jgi:RimJ/RimL family protein N-acetyltransferase